MKRAFRLLIPLLASLLAACSASGGSSVPSLTNQPVTQSGIVPTWQAQHLAYRACPDRLPVGYMHCDELIEYGQPGGATVAGWGPKDFQTRYNLPSATKGAGQIVAIVDAYDNPDVASDLAVYRSNFKLGKAKFKKFNQEGQQSNYPTGSPNWGGEIDLDVQMVSASCPKCTIYLIEANDSNGTNLYAAEAEAVKLGATIVSNSWGGGGGSATSGDWDHKGVTYLASAGDGGYGTQDPADYPTVVAVGGTLLQLTGSKYSEIVWPDSGGGCSVVAKPAWQHDKGCKKRTDNDVSAVAFGVASYDTYQSNGWGVVGGTSVSSPLVAGMYGLAGNSTKQDGAKNIWSLTAAEIKKDFHYIKSGELIKCPYTEKNYLCDAGTHQFGTYSGPTGWGTPNGLGAL